MSFFKSIFQNNFNKGDDRWNTTNSYYEAPPEWSAAPEKSHKHGLYHEAATTEYQAAEDFCATYPPYPPRPVPSHAIDKIKAEGARTWGIEEPETPRFKGFIQNIAEGSKSSGIIKVVTEKNCKDVCLLSNLPLVAGMYDPYGKQGFYYEVKVLKMKETVAIGTACRPYPLFRLPGWNRLSAGLHLDDMRKFFEDPDGGKDYHGAPSEIHEGDIIGCAFEFKTGNLFFTLNGQALPSAFSGIYLPRADYDVFAAIGISGAAEIEINFGGELFKWPAGNEWQWRIEGLAGQMSDPSRDNEPLPSYYASTSV